MTIGKFLVLGSTIAVFLLVGCNLGLNATASPPDPNNLPMPTSATQVSVITSKDHNGDYYLTTFLANETRDQIEAFYKQRWNSSSQGWQYIEQEYPPLFFIWKDTSDVTPSYYVDVTTSPTTTGTTQVEIKIQEVVER